MTIAALAGEGHPTAAAAKERNGASQLKTLPGETWEDIFSASDQATIGEDERAEVGGRVGGSYATEEADLQRSSVNAGTSSRSSVEDRSLSDRTPEEQEKLVRAFIRKFRAREIAREPEAEAERSAVEETTQGEDLKCVLCRRSGPRVKVGADGRRWCSSTDSDACIRIAQGRLGGATGGSNSALSGKLRPDGRCRDCKSPVKWVKTQRGKKMPVDCDPAPASVAAFELVGSVGTLAFYVSEKKRVTFSGDVYESHYQTCESGR